jgi:hypothetical protein
MDLESVDLVKPNQHGFRVCRSCETQLITVQELAKNMSSEKTDRCHPP